jgi:GMP synthase-like glutamine amidotransferase
MLIAQPVVADACDDTPWIMKLAGFLLMLADDYPRIRIVGICFGHQRA